jgi:hypothetical protein
MIYVYMLFWATAYLLKTRLASARRRTREAASEEIRLTAPMPPWRRELTCVPGMHRSDVRAVDSGHIARHHVLDRWKLRQLLFEPTAAHAVVDESGSGQWEILTRHIGRELVGA